MTARAYLCETHGNHLHKCCDAARRAFPDEPASLDTLEAEELQETYLRDFAGRQEPGASSAFERGTIEEVAAQLSELSADRGWPSSSVPDLLGEAAKTYLSRRSVYGPSEVIYGKVMGEMFPDGLTLDSPRDWIRFGIFNQVVGKLCRYAADFKNGHVDSIHDAGVYAFMLEDKDRANDRL
jgi:hypothetical protein